MISLVCISVAAIGTAMLVVAGFIANHRAGTRDASLKKTPS
ncbi:hypothetical protein [Streptomyces sp. NPDC091259]